jgi:hypothetical protein
MLLRFQKAAMRGNLSEAERNWSTLAVQFEPRLSLLYEILDRSSPSRVRFAAQQQRALDCCGPFQETPSFQEGKAQNGKGPVRRQSGPIFHCHRHQHTHGRRSRGCVSTVTIVTHRCCDDSRRGIGINDSPATRGRTSRQKHGCCDVVRVVHKNEVEIAVENAAYHIELRNKKVIGSNGFEPASAWSATRHSTTI